MIVCRPPVRTARLPAHAGGVVPSRARRESRRRLLPLEARGREWVNAPHVEESCSRRSSFHFHPPSLSMCSLPCALPLGLPSHLPCPSAPRPARTAATPPSLHRSLHSAVAVTEIGDYRAPPNALITLQRVRAAGTWRASNGVRPDCVCYEVTLTFQPQRKLYSSARGITRSFTFGGGGEREDFGSSKVMADATAVGGPEFESGVKRSGLHVTAAATRLVPLCINDLRRPALPPHLHPKPRSSSTLIARRMREGSLNCKVASLSRCARSGSVTSIGLGRRIATPSRQQRSWPTSVGEQEKSQQPPEANAPSS